MKKTRVCVRRVDTSIYIYTYIHTHTFTRTHVRILTKRITGKYQRPTAESELHARVREYACTLDDTSRGRDLLEASSARSFAELSEPRPECPLSQGTDR